MKISRRKLFRGLAGTAAAIGAAGTVAYNDSAFGAFPSGERLRRCMASPNWKNGAFANLEPAVNLVNNRNGFTRMAEFLLESDKGQKPVSRIPSVKTDLGSLPDDSIVWLGHSCVFMKLGGQRIIVDPGLSNAFPFQFVGCFKPFAGADIYKAGDLPEIDVLAITHDHYDHLDELTVKAIKDRVGCVVTMLGVGEHLESWGYDPAKIIELDWYESFTPAGGGKITAIPSQHFSGRTFKRNQALWGGFVFEISGRTVYHSGDGGYGSHFREVARRWPEIDLAILEDGQYNPAWSGIHLMPQFFLMALKDLSPKNFLACHNSKFDISRHQWKDPLEAALENSKQVASGYVCPRIGEPVPFAGLKGFGSPWWKDLT